MREARDAVDRFATAMAERLVQAVLLAAIVFAASVARGDAVPQPAGFMTSSPTPEAVLDHSRQHFADDEPLIALAELRAENVRRSLSATHYRYSQWIAGRRVHGAELIVSVSSDGRVVRRHTSLARPHPESFVRGDLLDELLRNRPHLEESQIIERSEAYRNRSGRAIAVERFTIREGFLRSTVWEVDAATGEILRTIPNWASATGRVFPANPVTFLNDPTLRDDGDSAAAVPDAAYEDVELLGLPPEGEMSGPRVRIVDIDSPFTSRARIEGGLLFDRQDDRFEEVNAYHHIDRSQIYLQSLGYTGDRQIVPEGIRVDVHANHGTDNSYFSTGSAGPTILLGDGGVDDAEDPDIVLHEYAHAIHDSLSPGALFGGSGSEARAISEGFGDYWAFSSGFAASSSSGRDPFCVGDWDARCEGFECAYPPGSNCLRRVDLDLNTADFIFSGSAGTEHRNGRIWSSFLRELFMHSVGRFGIEEARRRTDTVVLESLFGLPFDPPFDLVIEKMIDADRALFASEGRDAICVAARSRGFSTPASCSRELRGETLVIPGGNPGFLSSGTLERNVHLSSDATISNVMVRVGLLESAPEALEMTLVAPDDTTTTLKPFGTTLPSSVTFGRDYLPLTPLESLEGRSNPGVWTLRLTLESGAQSVTLEGWSLIIEHAGAAKIDERGLEEDSIFLPVIAHTPGAEGTFFVSDLAVSNPSDAHEVTLVHTPSGADGTEQFAAIRVVLPSNGTVVLRDLVRFLFGASGSGSLEIRDAAPGVRVSSRTFNQATEGTFGQTIPAVHRSEISGDRFVLSQIRRSTSFRTNFGFSNLSDETSSATISVRDGSGQIAGSLTLELEPFSHHQVPLGTFVTAPEVEPAWGEVIVDSGRIASYASVVDNRTGDSAFVPGEPVRTRRAEVVIPVAAHLPGARQTRWRTDLFIVNASDEPETAEAQFHRADGQVFSRVISLAPGSVRLFSDVVEDLFETTGAGSIRISSSILNVSSRTWTGGAEGTYGQFIGSVEPPNGLVAG
ncbi:MAG: M36 family metallopeptidase, partial [Thermoanaerobaculia bacterium]|nr:M36 family metallopeptidase [Thermoanaerobaculia bacterium]